MIRFRRNGADHTGGFPSSGLCADQPVPFWLWSPPGDRTVLTLWCVYFFRDPRA